MEALREALRLGVGAYATGEINEPNAHAEREHGIAFGVAGFRATERYGAHVVGACQAPQRGPAHRHIEIENPVRATRRRP